MANRVLVMIVFSKDRVHECHPGKRGMTKVMEKSPSAQQNKPQRPIERKLLIYINESN